MAGIMEFISAGRDFRLGGSSYVFAQGNASGFAGQLLEQSVIQSKFFAGIVAGLVFIGHQQSNLSALLRVGKGGEKLAAKADDGFMLSVSRVDGDKARMQAGARCAFRKTLVQPRHKLGSASTMEIRNRFLLFFGIF